jgi:hypothetical protein
MSESASKWIYTDPKKSFTNAWGGLQSALPGKRGIVSRGAALIPRKRFSGNFQVTSAFQVEKQIQ